MPPAEDKAGSDEGFDLNLGDGIDVNTFNQILEMDDSDDRDFSSSIVFDFFTQAEDTFKSMNDALNSKDLKQLSSLGHFLKGSSATLGLIKVRDGCESIQRFGKNENLDGSPEPDNEVCLKRITASLEAVKKDYAEVERKLMSFYDKPKEEAA